MLLYIPFHLERSLAEEDPALLLEALLGVGGVNGVVGQSGGIVPPYRPRRTLPALGRSHHPSDKGHCVPSLDYRSHDRAARNECDKLPEEGFVVVNAVELLCFLP